MNGTQVIVLNYDYSFMSVVSVERAFLYIAKEKVIVEKFTEKTLTTCEKMFKIPLVVRFAYLVREVYKRKLPWSKRNVHIRDNYECGYCGKVLNKGMTVDHVIPKSRGGKNTYSNTVSSCFDCNNKKGDRTPAEANMKVRHQLVTPSISELLRSCYNQADIKRIINSIWE